MMILIGLVYIFALASAENVVFQNLEETDGYQKISINEIVDQLTPSFSRLMKNLKLDPVAIPDTAFDFSVKGVFSTYEGHVKVNDGRIYDLSTIRRSGDIFAYYKNKHLRFESDIGFKELTAFSQYHLTLGIFEFGGLAVCKARTVKANVVLDFYINDYNLTLNQFHINEEIELSVQFHGNPLFDWIVTPITNSYIKEYSRDIVNTIEREVTTSVRNYLHIVNNYFPRAVKNSHHQYLYNHS